MAGLFSSKTDVIKEVWHKMFGKVDDPNIWKPLAAAVHQIELDNADRLAWLRKTEEVILWASTQPDAVRAWKWYHMLWDRLRDFHSAIVNSDVEGIRRLTLVHTPFLVFEWTSPYFLPKSKVDEYMADPAKYEKFLKMAWGAWSVVEAFYNVAEAVEKMKLPEVQQALKVQAQIIAARLPVPPAVLSGEAAEIGLAVASAIPAIATPVGIVSVLVAIFRGPRLQQWAEEAGTEAQALGQNWFKHVEAVLKLQAPEPDEIDPEVLAYIRRRARLYSPADIRGAALEEVIGLPYMAGAYLYYSGMTAQPPVEAAKTPQIVVMDEPEPDLEALPDTPEAERFGRLVSLLRAGKPISPEDAEFVRQYMEEFFPPVETEKVVLSADDLETPMPVEVVEEAADRLLEQPEPALTEKQAQYAKAGLFVAPTLLKVFGVI